MPAAVGLHDTTGLRLQVQVLARSGDASRSEVSFLCIRLSAIPASNPTSRSCDQPTIHAPPPGELAGGLVEEAEANDEEDSEESSDSHSSIASSILRFHVLCVGHQARKVEVAISLPSSTQTAIHAIERELDDEFYRVFSLIVAVRPQATPDWGLVLALPAWASQEPVCAIDLLEVDGRLFSAVLPWRLTMRDIVNAADLDPEGTYNIFPFGRQAALGPDEEVELELHGLVVVRPQGVDSPVLRHLHEMLSNGFLWDLSAEAPSVEPCHQAGHVCVVLPDRQAPFTLMPGRRQHYQSDLSHIFGVPLHWLTVQVAKPPVQDPDLHGRVCKGVALICDCIPNVPVPPRRPGPTVFGIVLDCRPLLLGWRQWIVYDGQCLHSAIAEHFELFCPEDFQLQIEGAELSDDTLVVSPGHVLLIQYVPVTPSSHEPGLSVSNGDVDSIVGNHNRDLGALDTGGSSSGHEQRGPDGPETRRSSRSRSPRGRSCTNGHKQLEVQGHSGRTCARHAGAANFTGILTVGIFASLPAPVPAHFTDRRCLFSEILVACQHHVAVQGLGTKGHRHSDCFLVLYNGVAGLGLALNGFARAGEQSSSYSVPVTCRLLTEPVAHEPAAAAHLAHLRDVTARLGGRWLRDNDQWVPDQDFVVDPDQVDQDDDEITPALTWICCLILKSGYSPEEVVVAVQIPLTIDEFIQQVQQARRPEVRGLFPDLLYVTPQPVPGNVVIIAGPEWMPGLQSACIDTTLWDGRLFASHVPDYVSRHELLQYADISHSAEVNVYVGSDIGALPDETPVHVFPGMRIAFRPRTSPHPPDTQLGLMLLHDSGWSEDSLLPTAVYDGDAYCLASGHESCLHFANPSAPQNYRRHIAARIGAHVSEIDIQAASPRPSDVAICGYPCRSVLAVTKSRDAPSEAGSFAVLLDLRPIHEAWGSAFAVGGVLDSATILLTISSTAPRGWHACLNVDVDVDGLSRVHAGQVVIASYAPTAESPMHNLPPDAPDSSSGREGGRDTHHNSAEEPEDPSGADDADYQSDNWRPYGGEVRVPFLLFSQEKWPEFVAPWMRLPNDIHGAIASVEQARDADEHRRRSRLVAVHPQPRWQQICLLALPTWQYPGTVILIDNRLVDGGLFAIQVPHFLLRDEVLRLAGVEDTPEHLVFSGDVPWPCLDGVRIPTHEGLLFTVCTDGNGPGYFPDVGQMLTPWWEWELSPNLPGDSRNISWILTDGIHYAVPVDSDTFALNSTAVAESLALPPGQFVLVPASPFIEDHAHSGHASSLVAVACRIEDYSADRPADKIPYLLDLRPILHRLGWAYAPRGVVDVSELGRRLYVNCPRGYHLRLSGGLYDGDEGNHYRRVRPGEVLVAEFLPDYIRVVPGDPQSGLYVPPPAEGDAPESAWEHQSHAATSSAASSQDAGTGSGESPANGWRDSTSFT